MDQLLSVLPADGSEMSFDQFIVAARSAGLRAELWLKAKHAGLLVTRINENGAHVVRRAQAGG